jgi:hypothetical protein
MPEVRMFSLRVYAPPPPPERKTCNSRLNVTWWNPCTAFQIKGSKFVPLSFALQLMGVCKIPSLKVAFMARGQDETINSVSETTETEAKGKYSGWDSWKIVRMIYGSYCVLLLCKESSQLHYGTEKTLFRKPKSNKYLYEREPVLSIQAIF